MYRTAGIAASIWLIALGRAGAAPPTPAIQAIAVPAGASVKKVDFTKIDSRIRRGDSLGAMSVGLVCLNRMRWSYEQLGDVVTDAYADVFREEMQRAGFQTAGDTGNLFERSGAGADYAVGGVITAVSADLCAPMTGVLPGDYRGKGRATISVEWQIYSNLRREVVAWVQTKGGAEKTTLGNLNDPMNLAFAENVKSLINAQAFRDLVIGGGPGMDASAVKSERVSIEFVKPSRKPASMGDVVGSVVTVLSGDGHGSGFLISDDGYVLTNQHVTAGAKYVKLRWSDKFESVGEVLREDKGRDVALIKTDARGRTPLSLRRTAPELGLEVYAVGAPLDEKLQGTVTRGIVSANSRVFDNYAYIQSDVTVNPGNSGGPLVTKEGDVLGLTVAGLRPDGASTGINLFIPAGDALDFLGLK